MSELDQIQFAADRCLDALMRLEDIPENAITIAALKRHLSWLYERYSVINKAIAEERLALGMSLS